MELGSGSQGTANMLVPGVIIALIIGGAIGFLAAGQAGPVESQPVGPVKAGLTNEDKNFLVTVANSQIDVTTARLATAIDWCQANGGQWNFIQAPAQVQVNEQLAQQLLQQGVDVVQDANSNWLASVAVISRETCIFPQGRPQAGQQAGQAQ